MREAYIERLPLDVLTGILIEYVGSTPAQTPLFLGKICATWRNVVWTTPYLWSSVDISFTSTRYNTQITLLGEWLERSGHLPLSITITTEDETMWDKHSYMDLIRVISPYAARWQHVDLALPFACLQALSHLKSQLLQLASVIIRLDLRDTGFPHNDLEPRTPIDVFESAPLLQDVDLGSPCSPREISLPWHQLTHISGHSFRSEDLMKLLRQAPKNLEYLNIGLVSTGATTAAAVLPSQPILLSHLCSLSLLPEREGDLQLFLPIITAPALCKLNLRNDNALPFPYDEFLAFLQRSSCSLQELRLQESDISELQLIECLRLMPSLVLANVDTRGEAVEPGSYPTSIEPVTLPKLEDFTIDYYVQGAESVECGRILNSLILPSAYDVSLGVNSRSSAYTMRTPFYEFLSPMSQSLQRLTLVPLTITASELHQHLKYVPSLVKLWLGSGMEESRNGEARQDDIIPLLGLPYPDAILPNLEVFHYDDALSFDGEDLVNLLAARWRRTGLGADVGGKGMATRLSSVEISTGKNQTIELNERAESQLQTLVEEGFLLRLSKAGSD